MIRLVTIASLLVATAAIAAPIEVTIEELNKALDAHVRLERDTDVATAEPDTINVTMSTNGKDYVFWIKSDEAGFAEILAAVKAAAAARVAAPKDLPVIIKEPTKESK
jgi:hypothetical protein